MKKTVIISGESYHLTFPTTKSAAISSLVAAKYNNIGQIISERGESEEATERYNEYRAWHAACVGAVNALDLTTINEEAEKQLEAEQKEVEKKEAEERAYYEEYVAPIERLSSAKAKKLAEIKAYDKSDAVNGFSINGINGWLDRDTRTSLTNTVSIEKAAGKEETVLWFGNHRLTLNCDLVLEMLAQLEMYAHECYNVTAQHTADVMAIVAEGETPDYVALKAQVESYDHTSGYPENPVF